MHKGVYPTDSGMHCVWDLNAFAGVNDYDSWARELLEDKDIERHISSGHLVPLNIGSDGAMAIEIRVGSQGSAAELTDRESQYLIVKSEPYRLASTEAVGISGIEYVAAPPASRVGTLTIPPGDYAATVHLLAWDEEPGMQTDDGPAEGALPDYVVLINPTKSDNTFRKAVRTFDAPGD